MNAILGVGLSLATVLLFAWCYGQFLRPQPKAWTRSELAATSVSLAVVALLSFAVAYLAAFVFDLRAETRWLEIAAVAAGAVLIAWLLVPRLAAPALRAADSPAASDPVATDALPEPANDPQSTGASGGHRPGEHRAA